MSNDSKLLVGLILGAAAGAIAGLLMAPASGKETREKIKGSVGEFKEDLDGKLADISDKLKDLDSGSLDEIKNKFESIKKDAKVKYSKMTDTLKDLESEIEDKISDIKKKPHDLDSKNT